MKLSILDQSPIAANRTARQALHDSIGLAKLGEQLGYTRYWIAEHHHLSGLASSSPEVMLGVIGAQTETIRLGPGAVLLPYYKPMKVAEQYHTLATLFSNRIDIGIGRAPGGSAEATNALSDTFLQQVFNMSHLVDELLFFIDNQFPKGHPSEKVRATPVPDIAPIPWTLGTSEKSAIFAAEKGLPYVFGHFMSDEDGKAIVKKYKQSFEKRPNGQEKEVIITVSVFCAETDELAEKIAMSSLIWSIQKDKGEGESGILSIEDALAYELTEKEKEKLMSLKKKAVIGNPQSVKRKLEKLQAKYEVDEMMIVTNTYATADRYESYRLLAAELL